MAAPWELGKGTAALSPRIEAVQYVQGDSIPLMACLSYYWYCHDLLTRLKRLANNIHCSTDSSYFS